MKEGLYGNSQNTKTQSIRFVIITALVVLVILGIVVWAIVFAVRSKDNAGLAGTIEAETTETVTEATENTSDQGEVVAITNLNDDATTSEETTSEETTEEAAEETTEEAAVETAENIPKTGPEDTIPFAIGAGALVAYLGSFKLTNKLTKKL